jgi:hypothetical protein
VRARAESLLSKEEKTEERRFQEEGEHAFHGERLAYDPAGKV